MRLSLSLTVVLLGLLPTASHAKAEVVSPCVAVVQRPFDGQTAVPPSIEIEVFDMGGCGVVARIETADGAVVPFDVEGGEDEEIRLVPRQKLPNHTDFVVELGNPASTCGRDPGRVHFRTGGAPRLVSVGFEVSGDAVVSATVQLSEPVESLADFDAGHIVIAPKGAEGSLVTTDVVEDVRQRLVRTFRTASGGLPSANRPWVVQIKRSLPFATGAQLTEDLAFELRPSHQPSLYWRGPDRVCAKEERAGCSARPAAPAGQAGWARVLLACVAALAWSRAVPRRS